MIVHVYNSNNMYIIITEIQLIIVIVAVSIEQNHDCTCNHDQQSWPQPRSMETCNTKRHKHSREEVKLVTCKWRGRGGREVLKSFQSTLKGGESVCPLDKNHFFVCSYMNKPSADRTIFWFHWIRVCVVC